VRGFVLWPFLPALALAHDLPATLRVEKSADAEQCPERAALEQRVRSISGRSWQGAEQGAPALQLSVRFERAADGAFVARVSASGAKPGQRVLRDANPTCDALAEAVSVAIALLLDSAAPEPAADASRAPAEAANPSQTHHANADEPDAPAEADGAHWRAHAALEVGGGYGLGATGSLLSIGRVGVRRGHWLFDLGAAGSLPVETSYEGGAVSTSLLFGSARGCYLLGNAVTVAPCLQVGVGRLRGDGSGFGDAQASALPWTALGLGLAAEVPLGGTLYGSLGASLWVPTRRQTFSIENAGIAWESKPIAGLLTAGVGLSLF